MSTNKRSFCILKRLLYNSFSSPLFSSKVLYLPLIQKCIVTRCFSSNILKDFATVDPFALSSSNPHTVQNLVNGNWQSTRKTYKIMDPLNGEYFINSPHTQGEELEPFIQSLLAVPKSGLHNPLKNPERYIMYGKVMQKAAELLHKNEVFEFFVKCIQRTMPKSYVQAAGELNVVRSFCENFSGDSVRFLVRGFSVPGDQAGQITNGMRWPYGRVCIISPFNFPLEIPVMQFLGALFVGNKPIVKTEYTQSMPVEQFIRFLHYCGMPKNDLDFINARGPEISEIIEKSDIKLLQFTGSSETASFLSNKTCGKVRIEDAGFDWKILCYDAYSFKPHEIDYVAYQCDQDAYAISGQKCSAQSILIMHENWEKTGILHKLQALASRRSLENMTLSPILSHSNAEIQDHVDKLAGMDGAKILFGGKALKNHTIPEKYGAYEPTAVYVPLQTIMKSDKTYKVCTQELFGPVQVVTSYSDNEENIVINLLEKMSHHLTAGVVSKDAAHMMKLLGKTINGVTYAGMRARTTGAPQNHWFGPAGDPRGAAIGTVEAILHTWTCHREIIHDFGPIPDNWKTPQAS